jgi:3-hydroxyacyl-[acyl-carrier-protein] dehydratase
MSRDEILAAIPHREPFLLLDEVVERSETRIVCRKTWRPEEWFFAGHYPGFPVTPGVLLCEAAMQAGAVLVAPQLPQNSGRLPVVARMQDVRFKRIVKPGETVLLEVEITDRLQDAFYMQARVTCENQLAVRFQFTATLAPAVPSAQETVPAA